MEDPSENGRSDRVKRQPLPVSAEFRKMKPSDHTRNTRYQPVIKKQLFTSLDGSLSENPYPVIAIHHHDWNEKHAGSGRRRKTGPGEGQTPALGSIAAGHPSRRRGSQTGSLGREAPLAPTFCIAVWIY